VFPHPSDEYPYEKKRKLQNPPTIFLFGRVNMTPTLLNRISAVQDQHDLPETKKEKCFRQTLI